MKKIEDPAVVYESTDSPVQPSPWELGIRCTRCGRRMMVRNTLPVQAGLRIRYLTCRSCGKRTKDVREEGPFDEK